MENIDLDVDLIPIEAQINEIIVNKVWWTGAFEKIDKTVRHLEKLICATEGSDSPAFVNKVWSSISPASLKMMNDGYCRWETEVENHFAHQVLTVSGTRVENYPLYDRFVRLLEKEVEFLKGHKYHSILFIGSGPFPITAILLQRFTGKKVDCLEVDHKSAEISRKVIKKLGLEEDIHVHVGNGSTFDLSSYDVVLAALLAKPKLGILQNILEHGRPDCKVLCRTSEGLRKLVYETTPDTAYQGFAIKGMQNAGYDDTISTVMLLKDKRAASADLTFEWVDQLGTDQLNDLLKMYNRIIAYDNNNGYTAERTLDDYYFHQLQNDVRAGLKRVLVIRDHKTYYGQLIINLFHQDTYAHRGDISSLMLDQSVRSKEVSLRLAECLIEECERLNLYLVTIDVRTGSSQEKLWKYLGFIPYGTLPSYSRVEDKNYSGVFMFQEVNQMRVILKKRLEAMYGLDTQVK